MDAQITYPESQPTESPRGARIDGRRAVGIDVKFLEELCSRTLQSTDFEGLGERHVGKVRDSYVKGKERTIVVTDRVSCFDVVVGTIPLKGQVLNQAAAFWFDKVGDIAPHHLLGVPDPCVSRVRECGLLRRHEQLPTALLTPTTKASAGKHDELTSRGELIASGVISEELYDEAARITGALFEMGQRWAESRGLILVDTKYELGIGEAGELVVIDEIHTPDSSRYWYRESYERAMSEERNPEAIDKEYVRLWLGEQGFKGEGPPPALPDEVRCEAARRYIEAFEQISGRSFEPDEEDPIARIARNLGLDASSTP